MRQIDPEEYPERERRILLEQIGLDDEMKHTEDSINPEGIENDICLVFYEDCQVVWNIDRDYNQYEIVKHRTITDDESIKSAGYYDTRTELIDKMRELLGISEDSN